MTEPGLSATPRCAEDVLDPKGKKLGRIVHGYPATTNVGFGGDDWKTLYFTSRAYLGAVDVKIAGVPVPTPKRS